MNDNLKEVLQQMLFMSDQQILSDDFKKINFKKMAGEENTPGQLRLRKDL